MDLSRLKTTRSIANLQQGRNDWFRIVKAQADEPASVMIYDEIGWFGVTAQDFIDQVKQLNGPLNLHLNSPGGSVFDGIAIFQYLSGRGDVTVHVDSLAASIASVIAMSGTEIVMGRNASMMIHDGFGFCVGNAADMREEADLLDRVSDNIASVYADRSGKPADEWRKLMLAETWYFGQEAVDAGLADRLAPAPAKKPKPCDEEEDDDSAIRKAMSAHFDLSIFRNTPERLKNLRNHVGNLPPDGTPPPTPDAPTEAPADTDRGFSVPAGGAMDGIPRDEFKAWLNRGFELIGEHGPELTDLPSGAAVQAATNSHPPFDGTHSHAHPAFGGQGGDDSHEHEHAHDGDADHRHDHGDAESGDDGGMSDRAPTRVLGIESMPLVDKALAVHHTDTVDEPWDGPAAVAAMPNDASVLAYCHAWEDSAADNGTADDPDGDADDKKSSWKFPHHRTKGGPANLAACRNGLARLPGSKIPDSDKPGVEAHLRAHLNDADSGDHGDSVENHTHDQPGDAWAWDPEQFLKAMEGAKQ